MAKKISIVTTDMEHCYKCGTTQNLHIHHCLYGSNHKMADKYGLLIPLCAKHHNMSDMGVHFDKDFDNEIKKLAQEKFELIYGHDEWMDKFHRNYL